MAYQKREIRMKVNLIIPPELLETLGELRNVLLSDDQNEIFDRKTFVSVRAINSAIEIMLEKDTRIASLKSWHRGLRNIIKQYEKEVSMWEDITKIRISKLTEQEKHELSIATADLNLRWENRRKTMVTDTKEDT